jgi:hypothetical protein
VGPEGAVCQDEGGVGEAEPRGEQEEEASRTKTKPKHRKTKPATGPHNPPYHATGAGLEVRPTLEKEKAEQRPKAVADRSRTHGGSPAGSRTTRRVLGQSLPKLAYAMRRTLDPACLGSVEFRNLTHLERRT